MKVLALTALRRRLALPRIRLRGSRRREARSAVLAGFLLVLAAHLGLAVLVETRKPHWRDPEFYHRLQRLATLQRWINERSPGKPVIVILGGSRSQMGLSPEVINQSFGEGPVDPLTFACSQSGALPVGEMLNFKRLLDSGVVPGYLLIEVLPPVLGDAGPMELRIPYERLSARDAANLRPYHEQPERLTALRIKARVASWHSLRLPLRSAAGLETAFPTDPASPHHLWTNMTLHGGLRFSPREWPAAVREAKLAVALASYSKLMPNFDVRPVNDRIYRDLLAECRSRGIRAALFTMPESPGFRKVYPPAVRERINGYLRNLAADHGIPFFDTSEWVEDEAAYMDGHHLLGRPAMDFSDRFARTCVAPWLGRSP